MPAVSPLRRRVLGNPIVRTVLSLWAWLLLGVIVIIWVPLVFVVWIVTAPFDRGRYWPGFVFRRLCVVHQWLNPLWKFRTSGLKVHDPRRPYVVVSNHESFADMFLISHLPWEMKWMSKEDFFKYPLVGWLMRMSGDIKLIRGSKQSIVSAMKGASDRLGKHVSVISPRAPAPSTARSARSRTAPSAWRSRTSARSCRSRWPAPARRCPRATGASVSPAPR
jgi:hypothetical protein